MKRAWPWPTEASMRRHQRHRPGYFRDYMREYRKRRPNLDADYRRKKAHGVVTVLTAWGLNP